jgi:hypothetical protein
MVELEFPDIFLDSVGGGGGGDISLGGEAVNHATMIVQVAGRPRCVSR